MNTVDYRELIAAYQPEDERESKAKALILQQTALHGDLLLTRDEGGHLTSSAMIFNRKLDRVLMVHHHIYQSFSWTGGHADGDADLLAVAIREAREETGIKTLTPLTSRLLSLDLLHVPAHEKNGLPVPAHVHYSAAFALIGEEEEPLRPKQDENSAVRWVPIDKLAQVCREAHMLPLYQKLIRRTKALAAKSGVPAPLPPPADSLPLSGIVAPLLEWYRQHARDLAWRESKNPYHIWVSEIMLQQTRVETVKGYFARFIRALPTPADLAAANEDVLLKLWEGLGYYNRVRNLQKAARLIVCQYGGRLPDDYQALLALPGIGPYTAGAICSIAFEQPTPAVDGNVLRVLSRLQADSSDILAGSTRRRAEQMLAAIYPPAGCGDFTQALMELGALICVPHGAPLCHACPLAALCIAGREQSWACYPVKKAKKARRVEALSVFILRCGDLIALERRGENGVLAGQWQLPNTSGHLDEQAALDYLRARQIRIKACTLRFQARHIFTHIQWDMLVYQMSVETPAAGLTWVKSDDLTQKIALPTAFKKLLS